MNQQLVDRIRQCPNLPSLPSIAVQVLDLAQKADVDIAEIARIISKDPAMAGKILRTVNSSFYGRSQNVGTISHALVILGLQSVKTLVLGFSLVSNLAKNKGKGFNHLNYWRRSIYSATAARMLAAKVGVVQQEEAFLAALLMDIGMLVLDVVLGDEYGEICSQATSHSELAAVEARVLGMTHAEVGGLLAAQWKFPPILCVPIANHPDSSKVADPALRKLTSMVNVGSRCADVFVDEHAAGPLAEVRQVCGAQHGINETDINVLLEEIATKTREVATLFEINLGASVNFESILKKANEALVDLTLQTQQHASMLEEQAVNLVEKNQVLQRQATMDALTGLHNRGHLDRFMTERFDAANESGKPLSVLLLDLDKFKSINDKHGHPAGDSVLKAVGQLLGSAARAQDLAARYGGEEMVLVLPDTLRLTATAIAESIRRAIASKPIRCGEGAGTMVAVTASIGVATFEPGSPLKTPAHLLKAADLSVYAAKHAGRNCVRVFSLNTSATKSSPPPSEMPQRASA